MFCPAQHLMVSGPKRVVSILTDAREDLVGLCHLNSPSEHRKGPLTLPKNEGLTLAPHYSLSKSLIIRACSQFSLTPHHFRKPE